MPRIHRLGALEISKRIIDIHGNTLSIVHSSSDGAYNIRNTSERILLKCNRCGFSWNPQIKSIIYAQSGCPGCASNAKMSFEEFVFNADYVYKGKYDYSLNKVFNYKDWITVRCKTCSFVWDTHPANHLVGTTYCAECKFGQQCEVCDTKWVGKKKKCPTCYPRKVCPSCEHVWFVGDSCPKCTITQVPPTLLDWLWFCTKLHKAQYEYSQIKEYSDNVTVQCTKCKHHIKTTVLAHMSHQFTCPWCK